MGEEAGRDQRGGNRGRMKRRRRGEKYEGKDKMGGREGRRMKKETFVYSTKLPKEKV